MTAWKLLGLVSAAAVAAAIALPNMIEARKHGNEAAAVGALKTIATAQGLRQPRGQAYVVANHAGVVYDPGPRRSAAFRVPEGEHRRSTFGVDVDTASYGHVRAALEAGRWPDPDAVRVEELVNYFPYVLSPPGGDEPLAVQADATACPWAPDHRLVRVALKAREVDREARPPANLVFLIDVSGSMSSPDKLPLVKRALRLLTRQLGADDRVGIAVYAGAAGLVLPPTSGDRHGEILAALEELEAGGSTDGGAGLQLAYRVAAGGTGATPAGADRVILLTDGDLNCGISDPDELERFIARKAEEGVFLTVLGFGMGQDDVRLEALADRGNGTYAHVDGFEEARKVFVDELLGTLVTVAQDVKVQVELDPEAVASYRLLGYANRRLADEDFTDDREDAGDVGAGHAVTALYEVVPTEAAAPGARLMTARLRYKLPGARASRPLERTLTVHDDGGPFARAAEDLRFAAAAAAFGLFLQGDPAAEGLDLRRLEAIARGALGRDLGERRAAFVGLLRRAQELPGRPPRPGAGPAAGGLEALRRAGLVDGTLGSGTKKGYVYDVLVSPAHPEREWMAVARPVDPGTTGRRYFVTNHTGVLYYSTEAPFELDPSCEIPARATPVGR